MQRGYIKIWRKLEDSGLLQMHGTLALFMVMLFRAAYKPVKIGLVEVDRGQLIAGRFQLCEWAGLSEQNVRTNLKHLHDMEILTSKSTNKYTIYTIVNYGQYQDFDTDTNQQTNQQLTNNQPTTNQQLTTIKELNNLNIKEINKDTSRKSSLSKLIELGVDEQIAKDWLTIRKTKKMPLTDTALKQIKREADIAKLPLPTVIEICAQENWAGFKSTWEIPARTQTNQPFSMDNFLKAVNGK